MDKPMKINFILLLVLSVSALHAQKKVRTVPLVDSIRYMTVDRAGELYVVLKDGQTQRYDEDGKLLLSYKNTPTPTVFDPRDGARLFAYFRKNQIFQFLNPSFEVTASNKLDPALAGQSWLITPSGEFKIWILDESDNSLKRVNLKTSVVDVEINTDSVLNGPATAFTAMRDYQGFLFLLHPAKGILVLNSMGRVIRQIPGQGIPYFNFIGEELYFIHDKKIKFLDLLSGESREMPLPSKNTSWVVFTDRRVFVGTGKAIEISEAGTP